MRMEIATKENEQPSSELDFNNVNTKLKQIEQLLNDQDFSIHTSGHLIKSKK